MQDGEEDIEERVMTSHTEKSEKNENCAKESQEAKVEELQNTKAHLSASLTKSKKELASSETSAAEMAKVFCSFFCSVTGCYIISTLGGRARMVRL